MKRKQRKSHSFAAAGSGAAGISNCNPANNSGGDQSTSFIGKATAKATTANPSNCGGGTSSNLEGIRTVAEAAKAKTRKKFRRKTIAVPRDDDDDVFDTTHGSSNSSNSTADETCCEGWYSGNRVRGKYALRVCVGKKDPPFFLYKKWMVNMIFLDVNMYIRLSHWLNRTQPFRWDSLKSG